MEPHESPHKSETVVDHTDSEAVEATIVTTVDVASSSRSSIEQVQAYLTNKIIENQCISHAQEIHECKFFSRFSILSHSFSIDLTTQWTSREMECNLPIILQYITTYFTSQTHEELSLEIQSSLCIIEQMFSTIGRSTPLQDMYTEEEQELLCEIN